MAENPDLAEPKAKGGSVADNLPHVSRWSGRLRICMALLGCQAGARLSLVLLAVSCAENAGRSGLQPQGPGPRPEAWDVPADSTPRARARVMRQRCNEGDEESCIKVAQAILQGRAGAQRDAPLASQILDASCGRGGARSCFELARLVVRGSIGVVADEQRARSLAAHSCRAGVSEACAFDELVKRSAPPLRELEAGCARGAKGVSDCMWAGMKYLQGDGVARDIPRGISILEEMCGRGYGPACENAGAARSALLHDPGGGLRDFETGCKGNHGTSCYGVALMYAEGAAAPKNLGTTREYLERGCGLGDPRSCSEVALFYLDGVGGPPDPSRGARLLEQVCSGGDALGCVPLATRLASGRGLQSDPARAFSLAYRCCHEMESAAGCAILLRFYRDGIGTRRDSELANQAGSRACELGELSLCN